MSRIDQPMGGFRGPRIVKPQANIYTVLLLAALLFVIAAIAWEVVVITRLADPPAAPKPGPSRSAQLRPAPPPAGGPTLVRVA